LEKQFQKFIENIVPEIARLSQAGALAYWQATTTGEEKYEQKYAELREQLLKLLSNPEDFAKLKEFRQSTSIDDPVLKRQLDLLYNQFLENQISQNLISELVKRETEIESTFTNFRATYLGQPVSNNDISAVLKNELDNAKRREVWEASKQIGPQVADQVVELVKLRNRIAQSLGFPNYHHMALVLAEIDPEELFTTLDELKNLTDEPFKCLKQNLDQELVKRYSVSELMPWHYSDPFFQEAPALGQADLDSYFKTKDVVDLVTRFYTGIGIDVKPILERSDLYERPGKNQHAYCIDIDREGDVRTLCNLRNDEYWMNTLLHELGHGVYDVYNSEELPYLLRTPAHILTTEAIAMLMGRQTKNPEYLKEIAGAPAEEIDKLQTQLHNQLALSQLIFIRWGLVVVYFEREMYSNPDQDLNTLWWDLVEELQLVKRPAERQAPDWAAKIHVATAPAYYQNYILGELTASQYLATMEREISSPLPVADAKIGTFLIEKIFKPGALYPWNTLIEHATGEPLNPRYFVNQFVK
jgi:peptidyl-dipeptidase A